jgi:hypothetical protein
LDPGLDCIDRIPVGQLFEIHEPTQYVGAKLFQRIQANLFERKPLSEIVKNIKYKPPNKVDNNQFGLFTSLTGH